MVDISAIAGMMTALRGAHDITKAMIDLRDAALIQSKVIDLQRAILDAQGSAFAAQDERAALIARVTDLEKEVAQFKAWDDEEKYYELTDLGGGVFAYALSETVIGVGPPHKLCANCFHEGHKSILQKQTTDVGRWTVLICPRCNADLWPDGGGRSFQNQKSSDNARRRR